MRRDDKNDLRLEIAQKMAFWVLHWEFLELWEVDGIVCLECLEFLGKSACFCLVKQVKQSPKSNIAFRAILRGHRAQG